MTLFICIATAVVGLVGLGTACWSIQRTHKAIHVRNRGHEDLGHPITF